MPSELTISTLTQEREVLFQLKRDLGILKRDLEVLAFAYTKMFFSLYDLKHQYKHTNIQQLSRSLLKLSKGHYLTVFKSGSKNSPAQYVIAPDGEKLLNRYQAELIQAKVDENGLRSMFAPLTQNDNLRTLIRYRG